MALSYIRECFDLAKYIKTLPRATKPNIVVLISSGSIQIQHKSTRIRTIVPIATTKQHPQC